MALSRLRVRLALAFSVAFAVGLALLAAGSFFYFSAESHRRLEQRLDDLVADVRVNLEAEYRETPDSSSRFVASEVVGEWPRNGGSFFVCDDAGQWLTATDISAIAQGMLPYCGDPAGTQRDVTDREGAAIRVAASRVVVSTADGVAPASSRPFLIVAFASTAGIVEDSEVLLAGAAIAAPLVLLLSLVGGYLLARQAVRPVSDLGDAIAGIAPSDLTHRLPVVEPRDEVGTLAAEFNALLERLEVAQQQNRRFVREAAHQIRTPLTLVLGEAAYELSAEGSSPERMQGSLKRIGIAAERMRRRVDELFRLAEAQAGETVPLRDRVELDELVLDSVDLMRARATTLGRALAIGVADDVVVTGDKPLLQEALLELIENALRHGSSSAPVTVSAQLLAGRGVIEVTSSGPAFVIPKRTDEDGPDKLGLPIVRWVASVHGGTLTVHRHGDVNTVRMELSPSV